MSIHQDLSFNIVFKFIYFCAFSCFASCEPWNLDKKEEDLNKIQFVEFCENLCGSNEFDPSSSIAVKFKVYQPYRSLDQLIEVGICVSSDSNPNSCGEIIKCNDFLLMGDTIYCDAIRVGGLAPLEKRYIKPYMKVKDIAKYGEILELSTYSLNSSCLYCNVSVESMEISNDTLFYYPNVSSNTFVSFALKNTCTSALDLKQITWQLWLLQNGNRFGNGGSIFGYDSLPPGQTLYRSTWNLSVAEVQQQNIVPGPAILEAQVYLSGNLLDARDILRKQFPVIIF